MTTELLVSEIRQCIHSVRGCQVIFDDDVAKFYEVSPKRINEQVRRNATRFPADFMFQLTEIEEENLRSQFATSSLHGGRRYLRFGFTEQGVAMLSGVLKSERAVEVNIAIMRAFAQMRRASGGYEDLKAELGQVKSSLLNLGQKYDDQAKILFDTIQLLKAMQPSYKAISSDATQGLMEVTPLPISTVFEKGRWSLAQIERIQHCVATFFGIKPKDLQRVTRIRKISLPRQIAIYLVRIKTRMGFRDIGSYFGGKDHTTVMHAYRKIEELLVQDSEISNAVTAIDRMLSR